MDAYLDHQFSIEGLDEEGSSNAADQVDPIADAAEASLADGSIHAVPVVNDKGDLVGLVTSTDLIRFLRDLF